jgi:phospholipid transport system substrate-binding protein
MVRCVAIRPCLAWALLILLASPAALRAESEEARQVVERLHGTLLDVMRRADELGYGGRRRVLAPVIQSSFDTPFMARLALGRGWRDLDAAEQERWLAVFQELSLATYAARFDKFSGERFETRDVEPAAHDTVLVKTELVRPEDEPVALHYRLRQEGGSWRIIDIYLNGTVSEVALRRSEYTAVVKRDGFDALVSEVEEKIQAYTRGEDPSPSA